MSKAIIFDMDGTLFQTNLILDPALEETFDVLRKKVYGIQKHRLSNIGELWVSLYQWYGKHFAQTTH